MDAAAAKALLQRKEGSSSVYDHLTEVILKLITEQPDNALAVFEQLSGQVKSATFPGPNAADRVGGQAAAAELEAARKAHLDVQAALFKAPGGDAEDAVQPGEPVQDLTDDANLLEWAGIGFGRTEMFRIHLALKQLSSKSAGARNLRFFGKILGAHSDYYVAEGVADAEDEEADDAKDALGNTIQKTGDGPNKYTYWVCSSIGGAWTRLPRVTPHQLIVAKGSPRLLSGHLDSPVRGHPPFPGKEMHYLRALLAHISAGTALAPAGAFQPVDGDENGAIEPAAEWEAPGDLSGADAWVHTSLDINIKGRTRPNPPAINDAGEEVPEEDAPEPSAPLKSIAEDPAVDEGAEEGGGAWEIKTCPAAGVPEGEVQPLAVLKSLRWPGAYVAGVGKKWVNVYVGRGLPVSLAPYQPALPGTIPSEYAFGAEETLVLEKEDVRVDPDANKPAEEGEEGAEE